MWWCVRVFVWYPVALWSINQINLSFFARYLFHAVLFVLFSHAASLLLLRRGRLLHLRSSFKCEPPLHSPWPPHPLTSFTDSRDFTARRMFKRWDGYHGCDGMLAVWWRRRRRSRGVSLKYVPVKWCQVKAGMSLPEKSNSISLNSNYFIWVNLEIIFVIVLVFVVMIWPYQPTLLKFNMNTI